MPKKQNESKVDIHITSSHAGRLDKFLADQFPHLSRSYLQRLINNRSIIIDNHPVSPSHRLRVGQLISVQWPTEVKMANPAIQSPLPFPVLYEDAELMVIDKPAGLLCHPAGWKREGTTLVEILWPRINQYEWPDEVRPGLVHRLDRDTSGVLIYAKTPQAHAAVSKQFARRQVRKTYLALVAGDFTVKEGTIECAIGRHPQKRQRFAVTDGGRWSVTKFKVLETFGKTASLVELNPLTGRTHQLRVQLASYHHPILGDRVYGQFDSQFSSIGRQMLHAARIEFTHPTSFQSLNFEAPLPDDFQKALKLIRSEL